MQQPREPELNFNQVKKDINLMDLVLTLGYQHNRAKSGSDPEKGKFHTFDYKGKPTVDQVIIYKAASGDYLYFNRADDRDKGTVIDFIKHRLEHPRIPGITAEPGKNIWASVIANAKRFLSLPAQERHNSQALQQQMEPVERSDRFIPDFLQKTAPLTDTTYLNARGLTSETLTNPAFAGRILNHVHAGTSKTGQPYRFVNIAFPQIYKDSIVGLEIKSQGFKGQAANSLNSSALWLSGATPKTNALIVAESAIDALSHFQLKQPSNALYASTSGQLTDNKVTEIKRLVENLNLKKVCLSFDNNLDGHLFDTRLIAGLAKPETPMSITRTLPSLVTVGIYSVQNEPVVQLHRAVKAHNQELTENYRALAGGESPAASPTLAAELITAAKVGDHSYQFHIPRRSDSLVFFNQALINAFPMISKLELDKSKANDWNDQLKESLKKGPPQEHTQEQERRRGPRR
ncbi:MAG: toprim domain-containing protein [Janthinobacterium lividum]